MRSHTRDLSILDRYCLKILTKDGSGNLQEVLKSLIQSEFASRELLDEIQVAKLENLIIRIVKDVPFWMDSKLADIISQSSNNNLIDDLKKIPILDKKTIRVNGQRMWAKNVSEFKETSTGGTTGNPVRVRKNRETVDLAEAALWRARLSWGIRPSSRILFLKSVASRSILGRLRMMLANKRIGEAFPSTTDEKFGIQRILRSFSPKAIEGYASGVLGIINHKKKEDNSSIELIVSTGEMMYAHQREQLESHFSAQVRTYYGSNEIGAIAFECPEGQLHICEEHVLVEAVNDAGQSVLDEPGRILVTDLDNYAMPFLRYELGDRISISSKPCVCGRKTKVISELHGRSQDFLPGTNGRRIQATQLAAYLRNLKDVGRIQFESLSEEQVQVDLTGDLNQAKQEIELIRQYLNEKLGDDVLVNFRKVDEIHKTARGKRLLIRKRRTG